MKKEDLAIIKKYCAIFRWAPSQLFSEIADQIKFSIPDLNEKSLRELRRKSNRSLHVHVRLNEKEE